MDMFYQMNQDLAPRQDQFGEAAMVDINGKEDVQVVENGQEAGEDQAQVREAKNQMVLEGRLKMNNVLGSGNLAVFNDLKQHFAVEDAASHISLLSDAKKVQKRESKLGGNDEVLNTLEQLHIEEVDGNPDLKDKKKDKDKDKDKKKKRADKSERQKAIANVLEKYVRGVRLKEIRPLHLDAMSTSEMKEFYRQSKSRFNLRFYDNRPLKRLSSLFTRETQIRIKEMENADIDYFSMQAL